MKQQSGFTLIELLVVIVILGILAAVALPKFINMSDTAKEAAVQGVAGSLGSVSALNHANNIAKDAGLSVKSEPFSVAACDDVAAGLDGGLPTGYSIESNTGTAIDAGGVSQEGGSSRCVVTNGVKASTFVAYGVAN